MLVVWAPMATGARPATASTTATGHGYPLLEGHGREIPRGSSRQEDGVAALEASRQQETHMPPDPFQVQRQFGVIVEQRRDGDVAAAQALPGVIEIHG